MGFVMICHDKDKWCHDKLMVTNGDNEYKQIFYDVKLVYIFMVCYTIAQCIKIQNIFDEIIFTPKAL